MSETDTFAVWINKRAVALMQMPFLHRLQPRDAGWQIEVLEPGRLLARFIDGPPEHYDLEPGDTLIASGEEIYIAVNRPRKGAAPGNDKPAAERADQGARGEQAGNAEPVKGGKGDRKAAARRTAR